MEANIIQFNHKVIDRSKPVSKSDMDHMVALHIQMCTQHLLLISNYLDNSSRYDLAKHLRLSAQAAETVSDCMSMKWPG